MYIEKETHLSKM